MFFPFIPDHIIGSSSLSKAVDLPYSQPIENENYL